jgi:hypothetical protein
VERQQILDQARASRDRLAGNLDVVPNTVRALLDSLARIEDLPSRLYPHRNDRLNPSVYFSDFHLDKGDGYIGNNFGQDLRNLREFLLYAKARGDQDRLLRVWLRRNDRVAPLRDCVALR